MKEEKKILVDGLMGRINGYNIIEDNSIKELRLPKDVIRFLSKMVFGNDKT